MNPKSIGIDVLLVLAVLFELFMLFPVWICGVVDVPLFFDIVGIILTIVIVIILGMLFIAWIEGDL